MKNSLRVYVYAKCSTCRDALKFLKSHEIPHETIAIREQPPTVEELRKMKTHVGELRRLFNSSGADYKALNLKERLPKMTEEEALALLSQNGNLVKRPFALTANDGAVGFKEADWTRFLSDENR